MVILEFAARARNAAPSAAVLMSAPVRVSLLAR